MEGKRKQVFIRDGYLCICGKKSTVIHHKHYKNIGNEPLSDRIYMPGETNIVTIDTTIQLLFYTENTTIGDVICF